VACRRRTGRGACWIVVRMRRVYLLKRTCFLWKWKFSRKSITVTHTQDPKPGFIECFPKSLLFPYDWNRTLNSLRIDKTSKDFI
jgi:hypothetical protein